jgi:hypothetical integral membrane protein (TIGR02206 family)
MHPRPEPAAHLLSMIGLHQMQGEENGQAHYAQPAARLAALLRRGERALSVGMTALQHTFVAITFLGPPLLWLVSRRVESPRFARGISLGIAAALVAAYVTAIVLKWRGEGLDFETALPLQLCDWAAFVTLLALTQRRQVPFELAYFWGLAGTVQALFTPAVSLEGLRGFAFLVIHAAIPAGVLWLMFEFRMRPQRGTLWRTLGWSHVYLVTALIVNKLAGSNYGFLSQRPPNPSLLDHFSEPGWLYVLEIDLLAVVIFTALYLPWWIARPRGTSDAP